MDERQLRLLAVIKHIPKGTWMSYGDVARHAGLPGYHRLVVRVLANAPDDTLPWHRVLRSDGRPGLAPGSTGFRTQLRRLASEGIEIRGERACSGRVPT